MAEHTLTTPEERAARRLKNINGFLWHAATYLIVNGFLWFIDFLNGDLDFAYWVSISWGIGLAFHLAAMLIGDDVESSPRYQRLLEEERQRELQR
ncbi:MAG: 2TM domain-containing protein [Acidimicrobiia bacterium]|nr:2TM domain-containing protein [Acidimicrobiia bacterium]